MLPKYNITITYIICMYTVILCILIYYYNRYVARLCVLTTMPNRGWRIEIMMTGNGNITTTVIIIILVIRMIIIIVMIKIINDYCLVANRHREKKYAFKCFVESYGVKNIKNPPRKPHIGRVCAAIIIHITHF